MENDASDGRGGALYGGGMVINCTFIDNENYGLSGRGGAIYGSPTVINCSFLGNRTKGEHTGGGAISTVDATIINCVFVGNSVDDSKYDDDGGGAIQASGNATIANCTFVGNSTSTGMGGAISGSPTVTNSIFRDNGPDQFLGSPTVSFSNVEGGFPGPGNIDADPAFVGPVSGDYRLQEGSPCIDAGRNWSVPPDTIDLDGDGDMVELLPFDLDGNPRFSADEAASDPGCGVPAVVDMGAYEFQLDPVDAVRFGDVTGDGAIGGDDLEHVLRTWGPCAEICCLTDLDDDGLVGTSDLLLLLTLWGT